jgi:hypothetical protein
MPDASKKNGMSLTTLRRKTAAEVKVTCTCLPVSASTEHKHSLSHVVDGGRLKLVDAQSKLGPSVYDCSEPPIHQS